MRQLCGVRSVGIRDPDLHRVARSRRAERDAAAVARVCREPLERRRLGDRPGRAARLEPIDVLVVEQAGERQPVTGGRYRREQRVDARQLDALRRTRAVRGRAPEIVDLEIDVHRVEEDGCAVVRPGQGALIHPESAGQRPRRAGRGVGGVQVEHLHVASPAAALITRDECEAAPVRRERRRLMPSAGSRPRQRTRNATLDRYEVDAASGGRRPNWFPSVSSRQVPSVGRPDGGQHDLQVSDLAVGSAERGYQPDVPVADVRDLPAIRRPGRRQVEAGT